MITKIHPKTQKKKKLLKMMKKTLELELKVWLSENSKNAGLRAAKICFYEPDFSIFTCVPNQPHTKNGHAMSKSDREITRNIALCSLLLNGTCSFHF